MNVALKDQKKFVIIDGNAIIHRAYHALPPMTTKDGTMVNAVYGFTSMLLKVIEDLKPDYLAVSFDVAGKTFRDDLYAEYKGTRVKADQELYDQIPLVYDVVKAWGMPIYTKEGFEADDVIGTIVESVQRSAFSVQSIVVTGDMDMLQLVRDEKTLVYELRKGLADIVLFDEAKVKEKYGFGSERIVDYKALRGDTSDNIPGVPGIGEKTATELILKIGGIEEIYKKLRIPNSELRSQLKPSVLKKLEVGEDSARMSYTLATIHQDVPDLAFDLTDAAVEKMTPETVEPFLRRLEFFSLIKRLHKKDSNKKTSAIVTKKKNISSPGTAVTKENIKEFLEIARKSDMLVAKEIIVGGDVMKGEWQGIAFFLNKKKYVVDFTVLSSKEINGIAELFSNKETTLVGHDVKQLVKALLQRGVQVNISLFDIMIASYILNSSTRTHDLSSIVARELDKDLPVQADQGNLFGPDTQAIADELPDMLTLYERMNKAFIDRHDLGLFQEVEMRLIPVLAQMELHGVAIDVPMLEQLAGDVAKDIERITKKIWKESGEEFNVASSVQLREVLFEKMKLPMEGVKKGKTGYSTAASELEKLRDLHPIISLVEEHRELAKLQNTYIDVLPALIHKKTGRIHTTFNQAVAATGRLSSTDPNLQNIPIRTPLGKKIRDAFIAEPGNVLIAADYSQIELRIVASLAEDKKMLQIFREGKDIHQATAAAMNGVPESEVTKAMRYAAKEVNFGVLYGMGAHGLSWRAGIPYWQAEEFIKKYFEEFAGVKKYVDQTLEFAKKEGYVETLFGRRRYIPELKSDNFQLRSAGERMAINMPIQGTAADLMKMAMIAVHEKLSAISYQLSAKMILQVHDELVLEVKEGMEKEVGDMVKEVMEGVVKLSVPIEVHVSYGKRWGEIK